MTVPPGTKATVVRWIAVALLFGGLLLALLSGSWGLGALVLGSGAILLGIGRMLAARDRSGCAMGGVLVVAGLAVLIDAGLRLLTGA